MKMQLLIAYPHLLPWEQADVAGACLPMASNPPSNSGCWKKPSFWCLASLLHGGGRTLMYLHCEHDPGAFCLCHQLKTSLSSHVIGSQNPDWFGLEEH